MEENRLRQAFADWYAIMFGRMDDPRLWQPMAIEGRKQHAVGSGLRAAAEICRRSTINIRNSVCRASLNTADANNSAISALRPLRHAAGKEVLTELGIEPAAVEEYGAVSRMKRCVPA